MGAVFSHAACVVGLGIAWPLHVVEQIELLQRHPPKLTGRNPHMPHGNLVVLRPVNVGILVVGESLLWPGRSYSPEPDFFPGTKAVTAKAASSCIWSASMSVTIAA